jgi:hypothetical protein
VEVLSPTTRDQLMETEMEPRVSTLRGQAAADLRPSTVKMRRTIHSIDRQIVSLIKLV